MPDIEVKGSQFYDSIDQIKEEEEAKKNKKAVII